MSLCLLIFIFSAAFTLEVLFVLLFSNFHCLIMFVFCATFFARGNILQYLIYLSFIGILLLIDVSSGYRSYFPAFLNAYNFLLDAGYCNVYFQFSLLPAGFCCIL